MKPKYKISFSDSLTSLQQVARMLDTSGYTRKKQSAANFIGFVSAYGMEMAAKLPEHELFVRRDRESGYYSITVSFSPSYAFDIIFTNSAQPFYKTVRKSPTNGSRDLTPTLKSAGYSKISTVHNVLMKFIKDNELDSRERVMKNG